jgi:hypothetical protein
MMNRHQYQRLMTLSKKAGEVKSLAALKAGMHRHTASKYVKLGHVLQREESWGGEGRTR